MAFSVAVVFAIICLWMLISGQESKASQPHVSVAGTLAEWEIIGRRKAPALRLRMHEEAADFRLDPALFRGLRPEALALVSPKPMGDLLIADLRWRSGDAPLSGYLAAIAGWAARHGHRRVSLTTIPGSRLAAAGIAAGFLLRPVEYGLLALPIRPLDQIAAPDEWSITPFALTSW